MTNSEKYAERERCAKVCDAMAAEFRSVTEKQFTTDCGKTVYAAMAAGCANAAAAIRAGLEPDTEDFLAALARGNK